MKPTAVLLTVILLMAVSLLIGSSIDTDNKKEVTVLGCDLSFDTPTNEDKAAPLPQPEHKEVALPKARKADFTHIYIKPIECGGASDVDYVFPPPAAEEPGDTMVWRKVDIEAEYPGGAAAWQRYLNRNLRYPQEAIDNDEIYGTVTVQFVVDKEGNVSNVEAVSGPEALCAEMVRVIKKSGKWVPAVQCGRQVKSIKKQPICIHPESEE